MAKQDSIVSSDKLKAIADAIRSKTHKTSKLTLDQMPQEIKSISGGGTIEPECGIVPTGYSSKGFVLSANSYGDVLPFISGIKDATHGADSHNYNPNEFKPLEDSSYQISQYSYLRSLTFVTSPEVIDNFAFRGCSWLYLSELPDTVEYIGAYAFADCYNMELTEIPASVRYIGEYAFAGSASLAAIVPYYDSSSTYHIGDTVVYLNWGYAQNYTCVSNIDTPEEWNSEHWVEGWFPELMDIYSPSHTYSIGDVVYESDSIYTIVGVGESTTAWMEGYYPGVNDAYNEYQTYHPGDVVVMEEDADHYITGGVHTCVSDIDYPDASSWIEGNYPELLGIYDDTVTYNVGDVACIEDTSREPEHGEILWKIMTCAETTSGTFDPDNWVYCYCPEIKGKFASGVQYALGDVVRGNDTDFCYTCIVPYTSDSSSSVSDSHWISGYIGYPELSGFWSSSTTYHIGSVVLYAGDIYTCMLPDDTMRPGSGDSSYWVPGYYPEACGLYSGLDVYHPGDVVYNTDEGNADFNYSRGIFTCSAVGSGTEYIRMYGCYPNVLGVYDPERTYIAGDVVAVLNGSYEADMYYCKANHPISGEYPYDSDNWAYPASQTNPAHFHVLTFLGIPDDIRANAFDTGGYSLIRVPWGEGDLPLITEGSSADICYLYNTVCTGFEFICGDKMLVISSSGLAPYYITTKHIVSSDLTLPDKGNDFTLSVPTNNATIDEYSRMYRLVPDVSLHAGDIITIKMTSDIDPSYSVTKDITYTYMESFDPLSSAWVINGMQGVYRKYECMQSAVDNICEFTLEPGVLSFGISVKYANNGVSGVPRLYVGYIDDEVVSTLHYDYMMVPYSTQYWISSEFYCPTETETAHTFKLLLPGNSSSSYRNTLQVYVYPTRYKAVDS